MNKDTSNRPQNILSLHISIISEMALKSHNKQVKAKMTENTYTRFEPRVRADVTVHLKIDLLRQL